LQDAGKRSGLVAGDVNGFLGLAVDNMSSWRCCRLC